MEQPQSAARSGPDPPWGVGVLWTGAVLLGGSKHSLGPFARAKIDDAAPLVASFHC